MFQINKTADNENNKKIKVFWFNDNRKFEISILKRFYNNDFIELI